MSEAQAAWVLADARALPEVFLKVLNAKELLASGAVDSAAEAARRAGISRSAFYKYKDAVFPYREDAEGRLLTLHFLLQDRPGVLSSLLSAFAEAGANILTVNQNIPDSGTASVSVSARVDRLEMTMDLFLQSLAGLKGVLKITSAAAGQNITKDKSRK